MQDYRKSCGCPVTVVCDHYVSPGVLKVPCPSCAAKDAQIAALEQERDRMREAISDYYLALDERQHGGIAMDRAFQKIEGILGMRWVRGAELRRRATEGK